MDQTVSEYVEDDETVSLSWGGEETPWSTECIEDYSDDVVVTAYDVEYDDDQGAVIVESKWDDFRGIIYGTDVESSDDVIDEHGEIFSKIIELRRFEDNVGEIIGHSKLVATVGRESLPVMHEYITDDSNVGVRIRTEIAGETYGAEVVRHDENIPESEWNVFEDQVSRTFRKLRETVWEDRVIDEVTLDQDDE